MLNLTEGELKRENGSEKTLMKKNQSLKIYFALLNTFLRRLIFPDRRGLEFSRILDSHHDHEESELKLLLDQLFLKYFSLLRANPLMDSPLEASVTPKRQVMRFDRFPLFDVTVRVFFFFLKRDLISHVVTLLIISQKGNN